MRATADAPAAIGADLRPISLAEITDTADLQTRTDRKYIVGPAQLAAMLDELGDDASMLEIDGCRSFAYESVYFDTGARDSFLGAARRRPNRFKVRTRTYGNGDSCWAEVKLRTRDGRTTKFRRTHDLGRPHRMTAEALTFISGFDQVRPFIADLGPVLTTSYHRSTVVVGDQRVTIDRDLRCSNDGEASCGLDDRVIIETKSTGRPGAADRALWSQGARPARISKFCVGLAALEPDLPANRWHRTIDRYVTVTPTA